VKRYYATIEEAWHDAFVQFALYGEPMTPYRCAPWKSARSIQRIIPNPNPWAFKAWSDRWKLQELKRRAACGGYHLTRKATGFILAPPS
jgi:hypothetical protein